MSDRSGGRSGAGVAMLVVLVLFVGGVGVASWVTSKAGEAHEAQQRASAARAEADTAEARDPRVPVENEGPRGPVPALGSPLAMPDPEPGSWTPDPQPGLLLTLRGPEGSDVLDARRAEQVALHVARGERVSPFLPRGAFVAEWQGQLQVPLRDRYQFRVTGRGGVVVTVGETVVFDEQLQSASSAASEWIESKPRRLRKGDNPITVRLSGNALGETSLRLWWKSSESPWEPIHGNAVRHDAAHPVLQLAQSVRRGRQLFAESRCVRCHVPADADLLESLTSGRGMREALHGGPSLARVGGRLRGGWIAQWLRDPGAAREDARMPQMLRGPDVERDAADLTAFLTSLGAPAEAEPAPATTAEGKRLFERTGCLACHTYAGADTADLDVGRRIALDHVVQKWRPAGLVAFLRNPRLHDPASRMPDFALSEVEAQHLAGFLLGADASAPAPDGDEGRGRILATERGCVACHDLGGAEVGPADTAPALETLRPSAIGCLAEDVPPGLPVYALTTAQRADLVAFLRGGQPSLAHHVPVEYAQRSIDALRCTQCHAYGGGAVPWNAIHRALPIDHEQLEEGGGIQSPPILTWAGGKLRGEWLRAFLEGKVAERPRPWLEVRMPAFPVRGEDLAAGLAASHGYALTRQPETDTDHLMAGHGRKLTGNDGGFNCVTCHAVGDQPATQVFETQGLNFDRVRERLRGEYFTRWMWDPPRIDADSRMPKYAQSNGKTALVEVLGGDAAKQFDAMWHYFSTF